MKHHVKTKYYSVIENEARLSKLLALFVATNSFINWCWWVIWDKNHLGQLMWHLFCHLLSVLCQPTPGWYCYPIQHVKNTELILSPAFCFFLHSHHWLPFVPLSTLLDCCCHMKLQRGLCPYNSWPTSLFFTLHDSWLLNSPCGDMVITVQHILTQCWLPGGGLIFPLCPRTVQSLLTYQNSLPLSNKTLWQSAYKNHLTWPKSPDYWFILAAWWKPKQVVNTYLHIELLQWVRVWVFLV